MASILIADDSPDIRMLVRALFEIGGTHKICGEATTPEEAIEQAADLQPDAVILDQSFNAGRSGLEIAPEIKEKSPDSKILLFTAYQLPDEEIAANPAVDTFLLKTRTMELVAAIEGLL